MFDEASNDDDSEEGDEATIFLHTSGVEGVTISLPDYLYSEFKTLSYGLFS